MAHKSLVPKQRCLTEDETPNSFESWMESLIFHISLSDKSARFLSSGDLSSWTTAQDRGFRDDGNNDAGITAENKMNRQAKASLLNIVLGSIASYAPVISAKFVKNQSTSLESIWDRLRCHYGFRRVGSRILDMSELKLEMNESRECLWERLYSFLEDQLLTANGPVQHKGIKREQDEEFSPTLLNLLVTIWLQHINPALPSLVKQRFSTQLRTQTVFTIREEISDAIPVLLNELEERESCNINRTGAFQRSKIRSKQNFNRRPKPFCCLCDSAKRPSTNHFLSSCPFLPADDKKYMNSSRTREINVSADEDESADEENIAADRSLNTSMRSLKIDNSHCHNINVRKVDIFASPTLQVDINSTKSNWTLDSGAEANVITQAECERIGLEIYPTTQTATQGDGKTPLPTYGEVHFVAHRGHHKLFFNGLVVKYLDTPVLAGMPFHKLNHIQINYSRNVIVLEDCCRIKFDPKKRVKSSICALRVARQTCILPGDKVQLQLPSHIPSETAVAVEPRTTVPVDMPQWIDCQITDPNPDGSITICNNTKEPVLIGRHTQVCQIRPTIENNYAPTTNPLPSMPTTDAPLPFNVNSHIDLSKSSNLSKPEKEEFRRLHEEHSSVFSPGIGCYNNHSGHFEHFVNVSPNLPPQRRGRIPDYCRNDKEALQAKFDELLKEGVLCRAEDVKEPVEYVHPSFLVKKPSGGHRLVTSFGEMAEYAKPQPTINSNVEQALHQIGQFDQLIITDLKESYFQIPLNPESSRYVGVISPYTGTYVYKRSVMGLPGSEAALEELLNRIFGDLVREGKMVKIADDIFLGSDSTSSLLSTWKEVLKRLKMNGLKLSPTKTKICPKSASILGWEWESGSIRPSNHRINALLHCDPPTTVKSLRSYLGCYKFISRVIPCYAEILQPLEEAVAGKESADKITWSEDLLTSFSKTKEHLKKVKPVTLPRRNEQLHIVTDASSCGVAATLYVVRNGKLILAGYFSAALKKNQFKLVPCELEALAIACSLKHFSYLIIQSEKKTRLMTDSKPCCLAYKNLLKGKFSASPKVTTFLSAASRYSVELLHISGSSNLFSDFASRHPVECSTDNCSVCNFVKETCESVVGEIRVTDILSGKAKVPFSTKLSWKKVQQSDPDLIRVHKYLGANSSVPKKKKNMTDVRRYLNVGITALKGHLEGLLAVKQSTPFKPTTIRVVIPRYVSDGLLTALHIQLNHPSAYQLKLVFSREFFCLDLDSKARTVTENCYTCAALKKVPTIFHKQDTSLPEKTIGCKFSADVVQRYCQVILLIRESITSYTEGLIVSDEKASTLRDGIIHIMSRLRSSNGPKAIIRTDPASGLRSLLNDEILNKYNLEVELGEPKNPNKNPIAESAIKELHLELVKMCPNGGKISEYTLAMALNNMNSLIRQSKLSAREAWTKRDMSTGEELCVDDEVLINMKYSNRCNSHESSSKYKSRGKELKPSPLLETGMIVYIYSDRSKLKSREKYLITQVLEEFVKVQKFTKDQFRNREYKVKKSDLIILPNQTKNPYQKVSTKSKPLESPSLPEADSIPVGETSLVGDTLTIIDTLPVADKPHLVGETFPIGTSPVADTQISHHDTLPAGDKPLVADETLSHIDTPPVADTWKSYLPQYPESEVWPATSYQNKTKRYQPHNQSHTQKRQPEKYEKPTRKNQDRLSRLKDYKMFFASSDESSSEESEDEYNVNYTLKHFLPNSILEKFAPNTIDPIVPRNEVVITEEESTSSDTSAESIRNDDERLVLTPPGTANLNLFNNVSVHETSDLEEHANQNNDVLQQSSPGVPNLRMFNVNSLHQALEFNAATDFDINDVSGIEDVINTEHDKAGTQVENGPNRSQISNYNLRSAKRAPQQRH